ncbi:putative Transcription factor S [Blattamonas nauphoetae]|uniref:DNA-directed RNA polymerase subunit n=1 Tax=Blattamonas nauphoetae TaxID=2049346 RepID=A0ABQ9Y2Z4_9EUKA|nr:putative Transcription factor S [Blattamonas nauphoetae]
MRFCDQCGTLLEYTGDRVICRKCEWEQSYREFRHAEPKKLIVFEEEKIERKEEDRAKAIIEEMCPVCQHNRMSFTTMQLRSADEGQTILYECLKCGHRYSVNN